MYGLPFFRTQVAVNARHRHEATEAERSCLGHGHALHAGQAEADYRAMNAAFTSTRTAPLLWAAWLSACGGGFSPGATGTPGPLDFAPTLSLPSRPAAAPGGSVIARELRAVDREQREARIFDEIARGNVPEWLRELVRVDMIATHQGRPVAVTFWVTADYLAVGSADDHFRMPLSPGTAQRVADLVGASLLTPTMVDAVWRVAPVKLGPDSLPPGPAMTTVPVFEDHEHMVRSRRALRPQPPGALVAGHKKDVVLTPRLDSLSGRVAIYGWHRPDGRPIQPLYTGHGADWVDYSHGIRLAHRTVLVEGIPHDLVELLADEPLAGLLSAEGPIREPRYPTTAR